MSGAELSPAYAANLASGVYDVKSSITREDFVAEYSSEMDLSGKSMTAGVTGGMILKKKHIMAVLAKGIGRYKGHAFLAIKGTASLYDALADLNAGIKTSHTGSKVHQGFFYAFDSILRDLAKFMSGLKDVHTIHCVGHSLGGAIATLAADWIKAGRTINVKLYTFGSPRVGLQMFSQRCTSNVKSENIYRMYHKTDPVPMVPTWPFSHVPNGSGDYLVFSPLAGAPWEYHLMKHYIHSAEKHGTWASIGKARPIPYLDATVERWLKSNSVLSLHANTLDLMNAALIYVVKKVLNGVGIGVIVLAASGMTLLDRLAYFLSKAYDFGKETGGLVYLLVKKMAKLIGIKVTEGTSLTVDFIRAVFRRLYQRISNIVRQAGQHVN